jgi:CubicO group peptidase (beta-lactamase class C family)
VAFNLLGLALENVTGLPFGRCMEKSIFEPLNMTSTSLEKPDDSVAVLPKGHNYWDVDEGVQRPTGGIYSSSRDLSRYLRYILTHYNALTPSLNWFQPASYSDSINSFSGMPWEIYRTTNILPHTSRPVTFVTKSGGLPSYSSIIIMAPDYDLGVTILVGGNGRLLPLLRKLVTIPLVKAVERMAFGQLKANYGGIYGEFRPTEICEYTSLFSMLDNLPPTSYSTLELNCVMDSTNDYLQSPLIQD